MIAKRCFDILASAGMLVCLWPLLLLAAIGIRLTSKGPIIYRAKRAGRRGTTFTMYKLRTMHLAETGSAITAPNDSRVFPLGKWLRASKVDELPQLFNVLKGEMSLVGPRPEDARIVEAHYTELDRITLQVPPGFTSPGVLYTVTHGDAQIGDDNPEEDYLNLVLPVKMALDRVYVQRCSLFYDLQILWRTAIVLFKRLTGTQSFAYPPELEVAEVESERKTTPA